MGECRDDLNKCLSYFVQHNQDGEIALTLRSIVQILNNILIDPEDISKRTLHLSNKNIQWKLLSPNGAKELMNALNWKLTDIAYFMEYPSSDLNRHIEVLEEELKDALDRIESIERKDLLTTHFQSSVELERSHRYHVHVSSITGRRSINEDEVVAVGMGPLIKENEDFFAVFDGHGGKQAASFAAQNLMSKIIRNLMLDGENDEESILKAFNETNAWILKKNFMCGSTAVITYIKNNVIYCANIGDSRCILGFKDNRFRVLSTDHTASVQSEKERIERLGGKVTKKYGVARVNGELTVSRAFGNIHLQPYISSEPSIDIIDIDDDQYFLVLASDGLFDEIPSQEVVDIIFEKYGEVPNIAEYLCNLAYLRGSEDNISVIVIFLKDIEEWES